MLLVEYSQLAVVRADDGYWNQLKNSSQSHYRRGDRGVACFVSLVRQTSTHVAEFGMRHARFFTSFRHMFSVPELMSVLVGTESASIRYAIRSNLYLLWRK
jgi:hypothetical protein